MGAAISLPFLDAMTPAFAARPRPSAGAPGVVLRAQRHRHAHWTPADEGPLGTLPGILAPLEPVKKDMLVLSNLTTQLGTSAAGRRRRSRPRARPPT